MTAHHAISVAAGNVLEESRELVALGPALTASRLEEGIRAIRLSLASLEASQRILEGQERDPRLLIGVEPSSIGGWWKQ